MFYMNNPYKDNSFLGNITIFAYPEAKQIQHAHEQKSDNFLSALRVGQKYCGQPSSD